MPNPNTRTFVKKYYALTKPQSFVDDLHQLLIEIRERLYGTSDTTLTDEDMVSLQSLYMFGVSSDLADDCDSYEEHLVFKDIIEGFVNFNNLDIGEYDALIDLCDSFLPILQAVI